MAEITAVGVYVHFWLPDLPQWIPALLALVLMTTVNFIAVAAYGEFEFWFALIKIVTIVCMILVGAAMILFGFYVGALFVIMSIFPWNQLGTIGSPFVATFSKLGIGYAAGIINFVVLTAALSSCNSGIFSTGRMLYTLALQRKAPAAFGKLNRRQVPANGILASALVLLIGVILNYLVPGKVFTYVTSVATFGAIWVWAIIVVVQMRFRQGLSPVELAEVKYRMPGYPYANWACLAFLAFVVVVMFFNEDTRVALYVAPFWFGLIIALYYAFKLHKEE